MSSWQHSIIGALVPSLVKKAVPFVARKFRLGEFDEATKARVSRLVYSKYYGLLYGLWISVLFIIGFAALGLFFALAARFPEKVAAYIFLGIITMIGAWLILGAALDAVFWLLSPKHFRDYVRLRQIKSGGGYPIEGQIKVLLTLGVIYYIIFLPVMIFLL